MMMMFGCTSAEIAAATSASTFRGETSLAPDFMALPEVRLFAEPPGVHERLAELCQVGRTSPNLWTDAYLASFARCAGLRLVTFDRGFARFTGLDVLILKSD